MGHGYFVYRIFLPFLYALEVTSGYISLEKYGLKKVFFYILNTYSPFITFLSWDRVLLEEYTLY